MNIKRKFDFFFLSFLEMVVPTVRNGPFSLKTGTNSLKTPHCPFVYHQQDQKSKTESKKEVGPLIARFDIKSKALCYLIYHNLTRWVAVRLLHRERYFVLLLCSFFL